ncbi:D-alanyl-D-alanine carboxypeptidase/D-alanyl-D-alanine-endopeptidase [Pacificitalea manganoxidans]|uniref:D-alanyl-D-alanine carboxypeptidase/D-alanyl-D-alanine-endopeptidase n=1 Tax=Pacificitalea manganoxidans TaxID=1411902 RepID=A0A291LXI4_9RHOB|nr:D-alanyl-D-alanine carboxypeptidase/D-alanyl-D-alanine-endopeptidase [Pacificitalea manganoxidans]ATI41218.1 D-alanyl-D-alanine carboxypeptidase/D-alanyl-D-alanine-endopeptidase [Pacificitalea manganoxidans]MDR6308602.1 D-alanyl-D-alanine carboxypeptidase/D-alanyl-D-alanine-endopeptidase (penicillin-binding protein 4) [Pacificitalea manganoxidans]
MTGPNRLSRRALLGGLLAGAAAPAMANAPLTSLTPRPRPALPPEEAAKPPPPPPPPLADVIAAAGLSGKVAVTVADAETGEVLEQSGGDMPLPPASTAKAITALYALNRLGPSYMFRTRVLATAPVVDGRLDGDLILAGSGDPTLDTDRLGDLVLALKAKGLVEITGRLLIWGAALPQVPTIDPGQPDHVGYSPGVSGLNLNFNRVHFEWRRANAGYELTMDARSGRYRPAVSTSRIEAVDRALPIYTYQAAGARDDWTVAAQALGSGGSRWLPVHNPQAYCADVFRGLLRSNGITTPEPVTIESLPRDMVLMAESLSQPLRVILEDMLLYSTNITAEAVGMAATAARGERPSDLPDSAGRMTEWLQAMAETGDARFVDHSGLGEQSGISPNDMVRALTRLGPVAEIRGILKSVPMRDANYTIVKNHPAQVRAKTGTLNFVSALCGFQTMADGRELAFAMVMADQDLRAQLSREDRERPDGGAAWNGRAKRLQMTLLRRWSETGVI